MEEPPMKPDRRLFGAVVVALALLVVGSGLALAQDPGSSMLGDDDDSIAQNNVSHSEAYEEENETEEEYEGEENETEEEYEEENEYENETEEEHVAPENVSLSEEDAVGIATAEVDGTVEEVELGSEDGTPAYEVELVTSNNSEVEVTVHANNGTVLETESEAEDEEQYEEEHEDEEYVAPGNVSLSEEEAVGIATAEADGTVEEVELESEDGTPAYEVELVTSNGLETEVTVHADDGTVLEIETEDE
jgi:uncharacterized membrane protein YkoI